MVKKYDWEWPSTIPVLDDHSAVKHEILKIYIYNYLLIRTQNPRVRSFKIAIIDGFCGGGLYSRPGHASDHEGSPLIVMRQVKKAFEDIQKKRSAPFELSPHFIFLDSREQHICFAKKLVKERFPEYFNKSQFICSKFSEEYLSVLRYLGKEQIKNAVFLLDQYGYGDVPFHITRMIFHTLRKAEVLLTFAVDQLINYLTNDKQKKEMLRRLGLLEYIDLGDFANIRAHGYPVASG